jgi:hypothetical protein
MPKKTVLRVLLFSSDKLSLETDCSWRKSLLGNFAAIFTFAPPFLFLPPFYFYSAFFLQPSLSTSKGNRLQSEKILMLAVGKGWPLHFEQENSSSVTTMGQIILWAFFLKISIVSSPFLGPLLLLKKIRKFISQNMGWATFLADIFA